MKPSKALLPLLAILLASCASNGTSSSDSSMETPSSSSSSSGESLSDSSSSVDDGPGYYKAEAVNENIDLHDVYTSQSTPNLPSIGTYNVLVLPIELNGYPFSEEDLQTIDIALTGEASETNYWETLPSFYEQSSFGNLHIEAEIASVTNIDYTPSELFATFGGAGSDYCLKQGVRNYIRENGKGSTKKFDANEDGMIDATIMIYSCPDADSVEIGRIDPYAKLFWAYTVYDVDGLTSADVDSPVGFYYFWSSLDSFLGARQGQIDCHTVIHEFGHILGADDYYDADYEENGWDFPAGGSIMMDNNVGDHDIATKLLYGWVKPYVVTNDATITINPSQENGDCILLADSWNGTGFDEYILIELYTPDGLNRQDAETVYEDYGHALPSEPGIRMWHVDFRLAYGPGFQGSNFMDVDYLTDEQTAAGEYPEYCVYNGTPYKSALCVSASNSNYMRSLSAIENQFNALQLIQAGGDYTFGSLGAHMTDEDLFHEGDEFSIDTHSDFFKNEKFNNGASVDFEISVDSLSADQATLSFRRVNG